MSGSLRVCMLPPPPKVAPSFDGRISWFASERSHICLARHHNINPRQMGAELKQAILVGDASIYKPVFKQ